MAAERDRHRERHTPQSLLQRIALHFESICGSAVPVLGLKKYLYPSSLQHSNQPCRTSTPVESETQKTGQVMQRLFLFTCCSSRVSLGRNVESALLTSALVTGGLRSTREREGRGKREEGREGSGESRATG